MNSKRKSNSTEGRKEWNLKDQNYTINNDKMTMSKMPTWKLNDAKRVAVKKKLKMR